MLLLKRTKLHDDVSNFILFQTKYVNMIKFRRKMRNCGNLFEDPSYTIGTIEM